MFSEHWRLIFLAGVPAYIFILFLINRSRHCGLAIRSCAWITMVTGCLIFGNASVNLENAAKQWELYAIHLTLFLFFLGMFVAVIKHLHAVDRRGALYVVDGSIFWYLRRDSTNKAFLAMIRFSLSMSLFIYSFIALSMFISAAFLDDFSKLNHRFIPVQFMQVVAGAFVIPYLSKKDRFLMVPKAIVFIAIASSIVTAMMSSEFDSVFMLQGLSFLAAMLSVAAVIYAVGITVFKEKQ